MSTTPPTSDLNSLSWQTQGGYQVAADDTCLYMREGVGSVVAGVVAAVAIALSTGCLGVWLLLTRTTVTEKAFGGLMLIVAAVFAYLPWRSVRRERWMIVYDRGQPGTPGEIRYDGKQLLAEHVRCLSTVVIGGSPSMPRSMVVAELHDGSHAVLGPGSVSTWPAHYAQQAASWMGLPFRRSIN